MSGMAWTPCEPTGKPLPPPMPSVPRLWPGETFVILAGGPSLQAVPRMSTPVRIIAIKDAIRLVPFSDCLYGCDSKWWRQYGPTLDYKGPRYALEPTPFAQTLKNTGMTGLETNPIGLRTGKNSGYQAINLAVHLGAKKIILLGFDMRQGPKGEDHWFGAHPYHTAQIPYPAFREAFETIVEPLKAAGVEVLNATPGSALTCFPRVSLAEALA